MVFICFLFNSRHVYFVQKEYLRYPELLLFTMGHARCARIGVQMSIFFFKGMVEHHDGYYWCCYASKSTVEHVLYLCEWFRYVRMI